MIERLATEHGTRETCDLLEASSSGYYAWSRRSTSARERADRMLGEQIEVLRRALRAPGDR